MKILATVVKSFVEQIRQFWVLLLTISMAPFFVCIYYFMWESTKLNLDVVVINADIGFQGEQLGDQFAEYLMNMDQGTFPTRYRPVQDRAAGEIAIKNKKADALLIIPPAFSESVILLTKNLDKQVPFELSGDLTNINYMLAATWTYEQVAQFVEATAGLNTRYEFIETPMGVSGELDEFDLYVPGLLVLSTIMLMFTGAITFVREPEQKTIIRLKLSKIRNWEFIAGNTLVQIVIGIVSVVLTLLIAALLGFHFNGSWGAFLLIITLTSISVIGFSLILASLTKTVNEVLVLGNFPLFLFMFFTGAMMPVHGPTLFKFSSYDFTLPGLMSPYHAVLALKKISIFNASLNDVWPELISLTGVSILYFIIGAWLFRRRHMKLF